MSSIEVGQQFGYWTTLEKVTTNKGKKRVKYLCECVCGERREVLDFSLKSGESQSCGCKMRKNQKYTRADNNHRLFNTFVDMHRRCSKKSREDYKHYGGRGIRVCDRWSTNSKGFNNFLRDLEGSYEEGLELERIDTNSDYCPENCTWVNRRMQTNNFRHNVMLEYGDNRMTLSEWAELTGLPYKVLKDRKGKLKWNDERCLTTKVKKKEITVTCQETGREFKNVKDCFAFKGINTTSFYKSVKMRGITTEEGLSEIGVHRDMYEDITLIEDVIQFMETGKGDFSDYCHDVRRKYMRSL